MLGCSKKKVVSQTRIELVSTSCHLGQVATLPIGDRELRKTVKPGTAAKQSRGVKKA